MLCEQELADKKAVEAAAQARLAGAASGGADDRSLEDLLSFIGTEPQRSAKSVCVDRNTSLCTKAWHKTPCTAGVHKKHSTISSSDICTRSVRDQHPVTWQLSEFKA